MKNIIFILIYLYIAGFIIFGLNAMVRFHAKSRQALINTFKKSKNYANNNTSKVRDIAVIIVCICAVIVSITALIMVIKMK